MDTWTKVTPKELDKLAYSRAVEIHKWYHIRNHIALLIPVLIAWILIPEILGVDTGHWIFLEFFAVLSYWIFAYWLTTGRPVKKLKNQYVLELSNPVGG